MRILYVLPESGLTGGGGIATYHRHASRAILDAGHESYLFTWVIDHSGKKAPSSDSKSRIISVSEAQISQNFGPGPLNVALSFHLLPDLLRAISDFEPDIIESSDFMAPMYAYLVHRRAGMLDKKLVRPVVLYNHGMNREVYRASADIPSQWQRQQLAAERSVMRWADRALVPSHTAMVNINFQMGHTSNSTILPEPYFVSGRVRQTKGIADRYIHMGRVSFPKGIDHVAHFLNVINPHVPVDEIKMIGRVEGTTFRTYSSKDYFINRLTPQLRSKVIFTGNIKPESMRDALNPGGISGYSLSFSNSETFNYAFLEMIEAGLFPFTYQNTAMAEFYPAAHKRWLIPNDFNMSSTAALVKEAKKFGSEVIDEISDYAFQVTKPSNFVSEYERIIAPLATPAVRQIRKYAADQVTVLMATRNPTDDIFKSIKSVTDQIQRPHLLVLSDGSDSKKSMAILKKIAHEKNTTLIISEANEGLCASRQKLIESCITPLAIFLDDDDILDKEYVKKTVDVFNKNNVNADAVLTWRQNFGLSSDLIINYNLEDYESLITNDFRMTSLIRLDVLKSLGFTPSMRNGEADDWDFWLRFFRDDYRAVILPEPLFKYNLRQGSMSWPWSKGQTALTSELLAHHAFTMAIEGKLPEAYLLDLYSQINQIETYSSSEKNEMKDLARRNPVVGGIAYFMFRMSRSIKKRL